MQHCTVSSRPHQREAAKNAGGVCIAVLAARLCAGGCCIADRAPRRRRQPPSQEQVQVQRERQLVAGEQGVRHSRAPSPADSKSFRRFMGCSLLE